MSRIWNCFYLFCWVDRYNIVLKLLIYNIVFFKLFFIGQPYTCLANLQLCFLWAWRLLPRYTYCTRWAQMLEANVSNISVCCYVLSHYGVVVECDLYFFICETGVRWTVRSVTFRNRYPWNLASTEELLRGVRMTWMYIYFFNFVYFYNHKLYLSGCSVFVSCVL